MENEICEIELEIDKCKRMLDQNSRTDEDNEWTPEKIAIARKAVIIAIVLVLLYIYSGLMPMFAYVSTIFEDTGSNLEPNMSAIIIGNYKKIYLLFTKHIKGANDFYNSYHRCDSIIWHMRCNRSCRTYGTQNVAAGVVLWNGFEPWNFRSLHDVEKLRD